MLARTRILRRINSALERGDVVLSASVGYGKSTLLRMLFGHRPGMVLFALTPSDADLSQLQTRLQPHLPQARTIVLDDVQHLTDATDALAWLNEQRLLRQARWVMAGRTIPPELQNPAHTAETLRAEDLAFGPNEAQALLADRDVAFVSQWWARLQGWPLALALLARGAADAEMPNDDAQTTRDGLFGYLTDAIFGQLPDALAHAVHVSALPRRFDDALLATLLNSSLENAQAVRQELQRRALFLEAVEPAGWFKYHDAVREFLVAQLDAATRAALAETLIERFEADGEPHLAIESALDAGLFQRAAQVLNTHKRTILNSFGRFASYERWLSRLPKAIHVAYPTLTSNFVTELSTVDVPNEQMRLWLDQAEALASDQHDPDVVAEVNRDLAYAYLAQRQTQRALDLLWSAARLPIRDATLAARLRNTLGATLAMRFELTAASLMFDEAQCFADIDQSNQGDGVRFAVRHNRANLVDNIVGNFGRATEAIALNIALFADQPGKVDMCYVGLCNTHEATGDWDALAFDLQQIARLANEQEAASGVPKGERQLSAKWEMFYWSALHLGRGEFDAAAHMIEGFCAAVSDPEAVMCGQWLRAWALRCQARYAECITYGDGEALSDDPAASYHKAAIGVERAAAAVLDGRENWQAAATSAIAFHIRLRARHYLLRWRVLFALDCHRRGNAQWRKHLRVALHALARDDYGLLLIRREPQLAECFWAMCVREGVALGEAVAALVTLKRSTALLAQLTNNDDAASQVRLIEAVATVGDERAIPKLAALHADVTAIRVARGHSLNHLESLPPPMLAVTLLGEFAIRRDHAPIPKNAWQRPRVRQLLQYFCVHRGQRLPRQRVLRDVWPNNDAASAASAFRTAFSRLGSTIEPYLRSRASLRYFDISDDSICFDQHRTLVQLDSDEFLATIKTAQLAHPLTEAELSALLAALSMWRTPLGGARYADWALAMIERLNTAYVDGCVLAANALLARNSPAHAEPWATAATAIAPWHEPGWQALIRAVARQDRRGAALRIFERAVTALQHELGAPPSPELLALAQRLRDDAGV